MTPLEFVVAVENTRALEAFRESLFAYPIVQGLHLLGLSVAVGLLALVDLRLAGYLFEGHSLDEVIKGLRPWFVGGFFVVLATGFVLFFAQAAVYYASTLFWVKVVLIVLAGLNAVYFEIGARRQRLSGASSGPAGGALVSAKVSGLLSLTFWVLVIVFGRLLAYFQANAAA